ncbi:FAD:protein FMN transferase [Herbiconiux sp.]|uniref:FAD:protein FMN transferase n=1 Tax=Herbiconiux sp. TaxID=1871186 RepID=UPI0025C57995|nr:FAD:protein FMN transferase [Herbiconiux sp.]
MTVGVHVFDTMGTTVSLRFADEVAAASVLDGIEAVFREFDHRFSLYRADSELSRVARGDLSLTRAGAAVRSAYADALDWARSTGGAFTPHRPDGVVDLSGIVKAQAMDAAARVLENAGEAHWMLGVGGDILTRGTFHGQPWAAGVVDPDDRGALICTIGFTGTRRALATSGTAERGEHIWRTGGLAQPHYRQVSVWAGDIVTADVLATALLAGGPGRCQEMLDRFDIDVVAIDDDGSITATPGLQRARGLMPA